jgi:cytochrome c peroxidase
MRFPLPKSKKILITACCFTASVFLLSSAFTPKQQPSEAVRTYCLQNIKQFQGTLDTFQTMASGHASRQMLLEQFKSARVAFKRFEFMAEYMDNPRYPFFNGVNAMEMDDGINVNVKPEGLQVIETELYNDSLDYNRLVFLTKQLKYRTLSFYLIFKDVQLIDTYIFEAMRFHLIRMEALSLVSFDSPKLRNNVKEISATLDAFEQVTGFYKDDSIQAAMAVVKGRLNDTRRFLAGKNFNTLDRLVFIKEYLQPLSAALTTMQQHLQVEYLEATNKLFRAVNLNAKTIYDSDFLNVKFFAQDKYYKNNNRYSDLGRKLFFDKRLSSDGTLSCGNCHQPANLFTDNLPTAITNKTGEFQQRNTPTIVNSALQAAYFYDLAATSLEMQINHVMINPHEFNYSYDEVIKRLKSDTQYVRLFSQAFPEYKNDAISMYCINTCIADFERQFIRLNSPFDRYMRGQSAAVSASVKRGFNLFMGKAQCGSCHFAPTFFGTAPPFYGNTESEVLGVPKVFDTIHPVLDDDIGRYKIMEYEPFRFSFKTSTVRNAEFTAPYMHNGGFKTLDEVIEFYNRGGGAGMGLDVPNQTLPPDKLNLTKQDKKDLISFIKALSDTTGIATLRL